MGWAMGWQNPFATASNARFQYGSYAALPNRFRQPYSVLDFRLNLE
jgi:hypothetical protein